MSCYGRGSSRRFNVFVVSVLVYISFGFCLAIPSVLNTNTTKASTGSPATTDPPTTGIDCSMYRSCQNCSQHMKCSWCFSGKSCLPENLRDERNACDEDDWYYGDCDKPAKEAVLVYVLLACALFLLLIVILLVLYIFFCKMPRNKDYEPVSTKDKDKKNKRRRTPLMSKKVKPSGSRTDDLKKKYQLDG
ncbi:pituitary tumor-transforming gene 1 protein-interacting protein-like [Dendronephthya gigantea]|uniref:pituitary tumor-transforming gene 1 protein-interacting protein-like n=1 Tax=Dendronephthya gigantea TaxID=151771 RepID=UPI001069F008|nr:pituitary tumor-transforming gene 1 protein-interacting protein-like [Dendronephthya gigantea]